MPQVYHCGAISLPGRKFLLFGGTDQTGYFTREYDRNFKILEEHKSEDTPGWIGWGTVLYQWGKVYVYGSRHNWDYWDVKVFNGFKWDDLGDKQEKL